MGYFQEGFLEEMTSDSLGNLSIYKESRAEGVKKQEVTFNKSQDPEASGCGVRKGPAD